MRWSLAEVLARLPAGESFGTNSWRPHPWLCSTSPFRLANQIDLAVDVDSQRLNDKLRFWATRSALIQFRYRIRHRSIWTLWAIMQLCVCLKAFHTQLVLDKDPAFSSQCFWRMAFLIKNSAAAKRERSSVIPQLQFVWIAVAGSGTENFLISFPIQPMQMPVACV